MRQVIAALLLFLSFVTTSPVAALPVAGGLPLPTTPLEVASALWFFYQVCLHFFDRWKRRKRRSARRARVAA